MLAASISLGSMLRIPAKRFRYTGNVVPVTISAILVNSPMPNQRMNSGTNASEGMVRSICSGESSITSPRLDNPLIRAATTPMLTPILKPTNARCSDTSKCLPNSPDAIIAQSVPPICEGAAMTRCGINPACDASSHISNSAIGLSKRSNTSGVRQLRSQSGSNLDTPCDLPAWRAALLTENELLALDVSKVFSVIRLPSS
ncbi:hypothetical protein D9M69_493920 [compost metagenome]